MDKKLQELDESKITLDQQILCCPSDWTDRYRQRMLKHKVPFEERLCDGEVCFILSRKYRPHAWKLGE